MFDSDIALQWPDARGATATRPISAPAQHAHRTRDGSTDDGSPECSRAREAATALELLQRPRRLARLGLFARRAPFLSRRKRQIPLFTTKSMPRRLRRGNRLSGSPEGFPLAKGGVNAPPAGPACAAAELRSNGVASRRLLTASFKSSRHSHYCRGTVVCCS